MIKVNSDRRDSDIIIIVSSPLLLVGAVILFILILNISLYTGSEMW